MLRPSICCPPTLHIQDKALVSLHLLHNKKQSKQQRAEVQACVGEALLLLDHAVHLQGFVCGCGEIWLLFPPKPPQGHRGCVTLPSLLLFLQRSRVFSLLGEVDGCVMGVCCRRNGAPDNILHFVLTKIEAQWMAALAPCSLNP